MLAVVEVIGCVTGGETVVGGAALAGKTGSRKKQQPSIVSFTKDQRYYDFFYILICI